MFQAEKVKHVEELTLGREHQVALWTHDSHEQKGLAWRTAEAKVKHPGWSPCVHCGQAVVTKEAVLQMHRGSSSVSAETPFCSS